MKKILYIIIALLTLTSCASIESITFANGTVYTNSDAYVAYDVYNELYENEIIENKPIFFIKITK
jgi:uncharacterized protein YceK